MGWLKSHLKKFTNTIDPIGKSIRKSTGGSYGNPLNFGGTIKSAPTTAGPLKPTGQLMAAPNGQNTLATTSGRPAGMPPPQAPQPVAPNMMASIVQQQQQSAMPNGAPPMSGAPMNGQQPAPMGGGMDPMMQQQIIAQLRGNVAGQPMPGGPSMPPGQGMGGPLMPGKMPGRIVK